MEVNPESQRDGGRQNTPERLRFMCDVILFADALRKTASDLCNKCGGIYDCHPDGEPSKLCNFCAQEAAELIPLLVDELIVCGTSRTPSTEVQDAMRALTQKTIAASGLLAAAKEALVEDLARSLLAFKSEAMRLRAKGAAEGSAP